VAVNLQKSEAFLCEISYAKTLGALSKRLAAWSESWPLLRTALERDCGISQAWPVRPWLFVPQELGSTLEQHLSRIGTDAAGSIQMPKPKLTWLEDVLPWKYSSYNRPHVGDAAASPSIEQTGKASLAR
jgi:hypothetical protein